MASLENPVPAYRRLIETVSKGAAAGPEGVNESKLLKLKLSPVEQALVISSASRMTGLMAAQKALTPHTLDATRAGGTDNKQIEALGKSLKVSNEVIADLKIVFAGASGQWRWWGVTITLTNPAAVALSRVLKTAGAMRAAIIALLGALLLNPTVMGLLFVLQALGAAIADRLAEVTTESGAVLTVYMYVYPYVEGRPVDAVDATGKAAAPNASVAPKPTSKAAADATTKPAAGPTVKNVKKPSR